MWHAVVCPAQVNLAADPKQQQPPATGRKLLRGQRRLQQITASQAEAEAVIAQSVENLYALGGVAPGGSQRYEWFVPDTAGPASRDGPVVVYSYVSGVDHIKHINAGEREEYEKHCTELDSTAACWTVLQCRTCSMTATTTTV